MDRTSKPRGTLGKCSKFVSFQVPRGEAENGTERILEEMIAENLLKDTKVWIQESEQAPNDKNLKKSLPRYIRIKLLEIKAKEKTKTKTLKVAGGQ